MQPIILPHGDYQKLESYQNSVVIFDATSDFCGRFLKKGDRTVDQMIQAARSGKQNIVEGCMASGTSTETEIKLLGVARASLEELIEDYRDHLRTHGLVLWKKDDTRVLAIRRLAKQNNKTYGTYKTYIDSAGGGVEVFCNVMISLIHQTNYLLDRQSKSLERSFAQKGGLRERMYHARIQGRNEKPEPKQILELLRELYRDIQKIAIDDAEKSSILAKIQTIANSVKESGNANRQ